MITGGLEPVKGGSRRTVVARTLVFPSVRLSPSARNVVFVNLGTGVTMTEKVQLALCARESLASQVTAVVPSGNSEPASGEHVTMTGGDPFVALGMSNGIAGAWRSCDKASMSDGQLIWGSSKTGLGGVTVLLAQLRLAAAIVVRIRRPRNTYDMLSNYLDQSGNVLVPLFVICVTCFPSRAIVKIWLFPARVDE